MWSQESTKTAIPAYILRQYYRFILKCATFADSRKPVAIQPERFAKISLIIRKCNNPVARLNEYLDIVRYLCSCLKKPTLNN